MHSVYESIESNPQDTAEDVQKEGFSKLLRGALDSGKPKTEGDDSIEPSLFQADDLTSLLPLKFLAAKMAGAAVPLGIALKPGVKFKLLRDVMQGENPLDFTRKELGQFIQKLGPDVRTKNSELIGAQLLDEFGSKSPGELAQSRMLGEGLNPSQVSRVANEDLGKNTLGTYNPFTNDIRTHNRLISQLSQEAQHPEAYISGTLGHEIQHAVDFQKNPKASSFPERFTPRVKTNLSLGREGYLEPSAIETVLRAGQADSSILKPFPPYVRDLVSQGTSPDALAHYIQTDPQVVSAMGQVVRNSVGNQGFRGNNASLMDILNTGGHFSAPIHGEMDIPPYYLAKQQAQAGGEVGTWEDAFPTMVKEARKNYKSPQVSVPKKIPPAEEGISSEGLVPPWVSLAGGMGALLAGAAPQSTSSDEEQEFTDSVKKLRKYVKKG